MEVQHRKEGVRDVTSKSEEGTSSLLLGANCRHCEHNETGKEALLSPLQSLSPSTALVLGLSLLFTPITTMAYNPVMPLFVIEELEVGMWGLGMMFTVLTVASLLSYALMVPALRVITVKQLLLVDYAVRALSGFVYGLAVHQHGHWSATLILLSRGLHGISLNSPALPPIYVGLHVPHAQQPKVDLA